MPSVVASLRKRTALARAKAVAALSGSALVTEFEIFTPDWSDSEKGRFLFDAEAAKLVMADYEKIGNDIMIDLEHLSLDPDCESYDPDARGWCQLEVRNGSLWAVNVTWTPDGVARLKNRTQRFISPTFLYDEETRRIEALYNIAICAIPATHNAPALVAASRVAGKNFVSLSIEVNKMPPELLKIAQALGLSEGATLEDILAAVKALQDATATATAEPATEEAALNKLPAAFRGKVMAALTSVTELQKQLAEVRKEQNVSKVDAILSANVKKLPKHLEGWAKTQSVETLTAFFKDMPEIAIVAVEKKTETTSEVELTPEEKKIAKLTNEDPTKLLEYKKKLAAKAAAAKELSNG